MIEIFLTNLIRELGATGVLIVGLYLILYKPIRKSAESLAIINQELGEIIGLLRTALKEKK